MKKLILTLSLLIISIIGLSQDLQIRKINKVNYEFNHTIDYDISSVYEDRIKSTFLEINEIKIDSNKVEISFKNGTSKKDISRVLSEISLIFNHQKYILI
jgi:hypothetical protein